VQIFKPTILTIEQSHTTAEVCGHVGVQGSDGVKPFDLAAGFAKTHQAHYQSSPDLWDGVHEQERRAENTHVDGVHGPACNIGLKVTLSMGRHVTSACCRRRRAGIQPRPVVGDEGPACDLGLL
jgi:hypothetical protein